MCSPQSFSASFQPGVYPRLSWPPFGLVLNHHLVGNPDVDTLLPCKYGFGEIPHFASVEQDSLDHGFVKHCCNPWCNALRAKDLSYVGPGTPSFLQLVVYPSNIVILRARSRSRCLNTSRHSKTSPWTEKWWRSTSAKSTASSLCRTQSIPVWHFWVGEPGVLWVDLHATSSILTKQPAFVGY